MRKVNIGSRERAVLSMANAWWTQHRPVGWSTTRHLNEPTVNISQPRDGALARAVASLIRDRRIRSSQRLEARDE